MSRSSDRWDRGRRVLTGVTVLLLGGAIVSPVPAAADPAEPVVKMVTPVIDLKRPVLDLHFGEADLKREARVEQSPKQTTITLDSTILFGKDSAKINGKAGGRLQEVARQLKGRGPGKVSVTGYTDDLGSAAHGKTLSLQRARAVAKVLRRDLAASSFPIAVAGRGEADPAVPNKNEANRRINRRVVVVYKKG